jgi:hypothetical protein
MWEFIKRFMSKEGSLRLLEFNNMLYPQYEKRFEKTMTANMFADLQESAKKLLKNTESANGAVIAHWQSIVDGVVPFGFIIKDKE